MNYFSQPELLQKIGRARIARLIDSFKEGVPLGALALLSSLATHEPNFDAVAKFFSDSGLPGDLRAVLNALELLASPEHENRLNDALNRFLPCVGLHGAPPLDRALELWFHSKDLVLELADACRPSINPLIQQSLRPSAEQPINPSIQQSIHPSVQSAVPADTVVDASACLADDEVEHDSTNPSIHQSIYPTPEHPSGVLGLKRFTDPMLISKVGLDRVEELLDHFEKDFADQGLTIPYPPEHSAHLDALAAMFSSPALMPASVHNALLAIEEFAAPENQPLLKLLVTQNELILHVRYEPELWALELWLRAPYDRQFIATLKAHVPPACCEKPSEEDAQPAQPANAAPPPVANGHPESVELNHSPRNKIARLPKEVRDAIDQMMGQAVPYNEIIQRLGEVGKSLNKSNLSRWKKGPHQHWVVIQQRIEENRAHLQFALAAGQQNQNNQIHEAVQQIVALRISELFTQLDLPALVQAFKEDPNTLARLVQLIPKLGQGGLACERQRLELAERIVALDKQKHPKKRGITPETLKKCEEALRLM